eukprot:1949855-Rhodomonas_salina.4
MHACYNVRGTDVAYILCFGLYARGTTVLMEGILVPGKVAGGLREPETGPAERSESESIYGSSGATSGGNADIYRGRVHRLRRRLCRSKRQRTWRQPLL